MGSRDPRFKEDPVMTEDVGPGAYDADYVGSLEADMKDLMSKSSKKKPAFGATGPQRASTQKSEVPAPGYYQPLSPRFKSPARSSKGTPKRKGSSKR